MGAMFNKVFSEARDRTTALGKNVDANFNLPGGGQQASRKSALTSSKPTSLASSGSEAGARRPTGRR